MSSAQSEDFDEFEEIKEEEEDRPALDVHSVNTATTNTAANDKPHHTTSYPTAATRCPLSLDLSSPSLQQLRLQYDDVIGLLQRLDTAATSSLSGHLKMSGDAARRADHGDLAENGGVESTDSTKPTFDWKSTLCVAPRALFGRDDISKFCFVSTHRDERVFVKLTMANDYAPKMMRNIAKNDVLMSYWNDITLHDADRPHIPFLPLRGWWMSEGGGNVVVTVYPLAVKLSQHIRSAVISDSDFCEFEDDESSDNDSDGDSLSDFDDGGGDAAAPRPPIDWRVNLRQMASIRDSVFKIAEFVANLHFDGVSHRNISMDNVFVDASDPTAFYISNYAQYDMDWPLAPHHSPEALLYREGLLSAYSTTASDVWSFGCLLVHIFGVDAEHCIHSLSNLRTVSSPQAVQGLLLRHLRITHSAQTKLIAVLELLLRVFTVEANRCSMEDLCCSRFFARPWNQI